MFNKRFSIGLMLESDLHRFKTLLEEYGKYINEIYFSLPLGDKFHSRSVIQKQFENEGKVKLFWELLALIKEYDIELELALNTYKLTEEDIYKATELLEKKQIRVDSISLKDEYYHWISKYFPNKKMICSYNNEIRSRDDYLRIENKYDYIVVGNANIRNNDFMSILNKDTNSGIILLLNNGCSFNCLWCGKSKYCREIFNRNVEQYGVDYMYAQQSILPFEIHEGIVDESLIDLFKLSTRNASPEYTMRCLDSYINNKCLSYIQDSKYNYLLWCRLGGFGDYIQSFDYDNIMKFKKEIVGGK